MVEPKLVKVRVPAALIAPCAPVDKRPWKTTRDIIDTANANGANLAACGAQVSGVAQWDKGNVK